MAKTTLQLRRGTTSDNSTFTGAAGEVIVNTTTNSLVVHDGTTVGGWAQAPLASPVFTGVPRAPTAPGGTNSTQLATTAFVQSALAGVSISGLTTSTITEGTNHYFTQTRARQAVSATGSISYDQNLGVFSYTQPTNVSAFVNDAGYLTTANITGALSVVSDPSNALVYDNTSGVFTFTAPVTSVNGLSGTVTLNADNIDGGTTNKYATRANVQTALASGGVTNTMLANNSLTINGTSVALGASATVAAAAGTLSGTTLASNVVASSLTSVGVLNQLAISVGTGSLSNQGALTVGTQSFNDIDILASFVSTNNNYNQVTVQNLSSGNLASTNFVAYNNQGTSTSNYLAMGINSSGYTGGGVFGTGSLNAASSSFLISATTDLAIGTFSTNAIRFVTNTSTTDQMTIHGTSGFIGVNNMSPAYRLDVNGDINFTGALRTSGSAGSAGYVLQSNGPSAAPTWVNFSSTGSYQLDSWSRQINGGTTVFSPTTNGTPLSISNPVQVLIHKNGQYQQGWLNNSRTVWNTITRYGDYTVSSGQVVFTSPPQIGDNIVAIVMGGGATTPVYTTYPFNALDIVTGT